MTQKPIDNQRLERMPPQAIEIEQAVLGAMMLEQRAVGHAIEILDPNCFYNTSHCWIFEAMLSIDTKVDLHKFRTGRLRDEDWMHLTRYIERLAQAPIFIDDTPAISVFEAQAKAHRLHREYGIGLIIVDYLQLMCGQAKTSSHERELTHISRRLKDLAKELDLPVLALVQISYSEDGFMNPRPHLSDLPEGIEQAANVVMFIYRPDMYGLTSPDGESLENLAEIIIDKQRNGPPCCSVTLKWNAESATYESLAPE